MKSLFKQRDFIPRRFFTDLNYLKDNVVATTKCRGSSRQVKTGSGFTLLEILIVAALICFAAGLGLVVSLDIYRSYNFQSEENLVLGLLQKARSQALNNIDQTPHGVYLETGSYVLFEGADYSHRSTSQDLSFPGSVNLTIGGSNEAVFSPLSGTTTAVSIILGDGINPSAVIDLNYEGSINVH